MTYGGGVVSLNLRTEEFGSFGPGVVAVRCSSNREVDEAHERAMAAGATVFHDLGTSFIAYNFTIADPDGNLFWFHHETGPLDELRGAS